MSLCGDQYLLQAYVDGQLAPEEAAAVAAHCRACQRCGRLVAELEVVCGLVRSGSVTPPTEAGGLAERLMAAVAGIEPLAALQCEEAREWVSLGLDGELTHEQTQRLQAHLLACGACYAWSRELEATTALLRAVGQEQAPVGLLERVQAAAEEAAGEKPLVLRPTWRQWGVKLAGVAAAAALLVALLMNMLAPATRLAPGVAVTPEPPALVAAAPQPAEEPKLTPATAPVVAERTDRQPRPVTARVPATAPRAREEARAVTPPRPVTVAEAPRVRPLEAPPGPVASDAGRRGAPYAPPMTAVAVAPSGLERLGPAEIAVPAVPTPARSPEPGLAARAPVAPSPTRVATAEVVKATPEPLTTAPKPATTTPRRPGWVSRPVESDREIYRSEDTSVRLAMMRGELDKDVKQIRDSQVKSLFVIK